MQGQLRAGIAIPSDGACLPAQYMAAAGSRGWEMFRSRPDGFGVSGLVLGFRRGLVRVLGRTLRGVLLKVSVTLLQLACRDPYAAVAEHASFACDGYRVQHVGHEMQTLDDTMPPSAAHAKTYPSVLEQTT